MRYSLGFRVWHWFNAFVISGLLATVFLRKTFLSWRTNSEIIMNQLTAIDVEITATQAKIIAKAIRAGMWEWHIILGYALAFSLLYRIVLFFRDSSQKKLWSELDLHKKIVKVSYYIFYAVLFIMTVSGFVIYFHEVLGLSSEKAHDIKEVHEFLYNFILIFVPLHIIGVIIAENRDEKGIVSGMINGKECKEM